LGINFFFSYDLSQRLFLEELKGLAREQRDKVILASGSGARTPGGLRAVRRKILAALEAEVLDVFFAEYIHPGDDIATVFAPGGVLDELQRWKAEGAIRYVGATAHDRKLARLLAEDARVNVLMHRFNMAHRKAESEVFPMALNAHTTVLAFTATRWGTLLKPHPQWSGRVPTAADCYRFCLAQPAVEVVLSAPKTVAELDENTRSMTFPPMNGAELEQWQRFGDLVYKDGGGQGHDFESQWP
jgi:aryl-alcohol dehydrogenase-like predicted oxidoreductase